MVLLALRLIIFTILHGNVASKYYYKELDGTYDVYYGPTAICGYKELKPPKSYKSDFGDRGDRPGRCFNGDFMCIAPYRTDETEVFECVVDYQCPRYFKCCQPNCFQHKICQPAVIYHHEPAPTTSRLTTSNITVSLTTLTTARPSAPTTFTSITTSSLEPGTTTLMVPSPELVTLPTPYANKSTQLTTKISSETTKKLEVVTTYKPTVFITSTSTEESEITDGSSDDEDLTFSGDHESTTSDTNTSSGTTTLFPSRTTVAASTSIEEEIGITNDTSDDEDLTFSGDHELTSVGISTLPHKSSTITLTKTTASVSNPLTTVVSTESVPSTVLTTETVKFEEIPPVERRFGSTVFKPEQNSTLGSSRQPASNLVKGFEGTSTVGIVSTTIINTLSSKVKPTGITNITSDDEDLVFSGDYKTTSEYIHSSSGKLFTRSTVRSALAISSTEPLTSTVKSSSTIGNTIYTRSETSPTSSETSVKSTPLNNVTSTSKYISSSSDKLPTESTVKLALATSSTEPLTSIIKSSSAIGNTIYTRSETSPISLETSVKTTVLNNATSAPDTSTERVMYKGTTDHEDSESSGDGADLNTKHRSFSTYDEDLTYSGDGTDVTTSEVLHKYTTAEDALFFSEDDMLRTDAGSEITSSALPEVKNTQVIVTSMLLQTELTSNVSEQSTKGLETPLKWTESYTNARTTIISESLIPTTVVESTSIAPVTNTKTTASTKMKETSSEASLTSYEPTVIRKEAETMDGLGNVPYGNQVSVVNKLLGSLRKVPITIQEAGDDNVDHYFNTFLGLLRRIPPILEQADINITDYFIGNQHISESAEYEEDNKPTVVITSTEMPLNDQRKTDEINNGLKEHLDAESKSLSTTLQKEFPTSVLPSKLLLEILAIHKVKGNPLEVARTTCHMEQSKNITFESSNKVPDGKEAVRETVIPSPTEEIEESGTNYVQVFPKETEGETSAAKEIAEPTSYVYVSRI